MLTYNLIPRIDGFVPNMYVSGSFISTNILATGVADIPAIPAVAQVVEFSPTVVTADETYRATINGIDYNYTVSMGDTVQTVVEALQLLMDANTDVTCSEDDVIITCTADLAGTAFTYGTTVLDITPPVVTLSGSTPITIAQGSTYSDAGAIWTDSEDGSGTISTATSGTVDTNTVGTYILEYTYTDMAGNTGNIVMRTVNVTDQTTPVVVLSGGDTSIGW